jgi:Lysozyme like domain
VATSVGTVTAGSGKLTFNQLEQLWIAAGGSKKLAPTMAAVALAESGGNYGPNEINNNPSTGDYSVGLWQINYFGSLYPSRTKRYGTPQRLAADPLANAKAAVDLARDGAGLDNWTTYKSGSYLSKLPPGDVFNKGVQTAGINTGLSGSALHDLGVLFGVPQTKALLSGGAPNSPEAGTVSAVKSATSWISLIPDALAVVGGGLLFLVSIILIGADIGIEQLGGSKPAKIATKFTPAGRVATRVRSTSTTTQNNGDLQNAKVRTEEEKRKSVRAARRKNLELAKETRAQRDAREKKAYYRGAADATP